MYPHLFANNTFITFSLVTLLSSLLLWNIFLSNNSSIVIPKKEIHITLMMIVFKNAKFQKKIMINNIEMFIIINTFEFALVCLSALFL